MKSLIIISLLCSILHAGPIKNPNNELLTCDSETPGSYNWFFKTAYVAEINDEYLLGAFEGKCFKKIYPSLIETDKFFIVTLHATESKSMWCSDMAIITTGRTTTWKMMALQGHYKIKLDKYFMSKYEQAYIRKRGIKVMRSCSSITQIPGELFSFIKLFAGGFSVAPMIPGFGKHTPDYQINANVQLLKDYVGYEVERRKEIINIEIDKNKIKSGDFIGLTRFDGLDQFINVGAGSRLGHTTIAMWEDGELYITESQAGWYWPRAGIQKNKWDDWYKWAREADMNIVLIPMKEENRKNFDVAKAWKRFYELQGLDYGFRNFLFSSVDTTYDSLPATLDESFVTVVFQVVEKFSPTAVDMIIGEAINKRLNTENLRIADLYEEIYKKDTTINEVLAIVEEEDWVYSNGPNYVCSCYVFAILKASKVFGDVDFIPQEQTPKDLYSMDIWDFSGENIPDECKEDTDKNNLKICQLYGKMVLRLDDNPGYLTAYNNMGNSCPAIGPDFERTPNC